MLDFIRQTKAFERIAMSKGMTAHTQGVYRALFSINNDGGWQSTFEYPIGLIAKMAGTSVNTVHRAKVQLKEAGLIDYDVTGATKGMKHTWHLIDLVGSKERSKAHRQKAAAATDSSDENFFIQTFDKNMTRIRNNPDKIMTRTCNNPDKNLTKSCNNPDKIEAEDRRHDATCEAAKLTKTNLTKTKTNLTETAEAACRAAENDTMGEMSIAASDMTMSTGAEQQCLFAWEERTIKETVAPVCIDTPETVAAAMIEEEKEATMTEATAKSLEEAHRKSNAVWLEANQLCDQLIKEAKASKDRAAQYDEYNSAQSAAERNRAAFGCIHSFQAFDNDVDDDPSREFRAELNATGVEVEIQTEAKGMAKVILEIDCGVAAMIRKYTERKRFKACADDKAKWQKMRDEHGEYNLIAAIAEGLKKDQGSYVAYVEKILSAWQGRNGHGYNARLDKARRLKEYRAKLQAKRDAEEQAKRAAEEFENV